MITRLANLLERFVRIAHRVNSWLVFITVKEQQSKTTRGKKQRKRRVHLEESILVESGRACLFSPAANCENRTKCYLRKDHLRSFIGTFWSSMKISVSQGTNMFDTVNDSSFIESCLLVLETDCPPSYQTSLWEQFCQQPFKVNVLRKVNNTVRSQKKW